MTESILSKIVSVSTHQPFKKDLLETIKKISTPGKGILAADESIPTIGSRFASINIENTEENRRTYRNLLFSTPGIENSVSGVIMFEETLDQTNGESVTFSDYLRDKGVSIGVKVDCGTRQLPFSAEGNKYSVGFEHLEKRCQQFYEKGVRFAKWRSVLQVLPTGVCPNAVAQVAREQALYAAICQRNGLVPIVEPELLTDGNHSREETLFCCEKILAAVFKELKNYNVLLEGCLLKPAMVLSGVDHESRKSESSKERIQNDSCATLRGLSRTVPPALGGVVFLSGGQSEEEATVHLNEINKRKLPWFVSFSYGRALQSSTLKIWAGKEENREKAQKAFGERLENNSKAQKGELEIDWDKFNSGESLYVSNYTY